MSCDCQGRENIPACCVTFKGERLFMKRRTKEIKQQARKALQGHCGIVIMGIILFFFLTQKKLKLHTTHAFIAIWTIVFCALIFDILSIIAIQNRQYLPDLLVIFICKIYFLLNKWII